MEEWARPSEFHERAQELDFTRKRFVQSNDFVKMQGGAVKMAGGVRDSK